MSIALFTAFSPESGGGAAQIRSLLPQLLDLDVRWYYLAPQKAETSSAEWLGPPIPALSFLTDLLSRTARTPSSHTACSKLARRMAGDIYWVIAHNEGVAVADELLRMGRHVHVSVHDDPAVVFDMSRKYRPFKSVVQHVFEHVLQTASSVDVIGEGMRRSYQQEYGISSSVLYRYASALPEINAAPPHSELRIGHIGHVYHPASFGAFLHACQEYAGEVGRPLKIVTIGASPRINGLVAKEPGVFSSLGQMAESDAVPALASCDFVYAMYPDLERFRRFRQTSVPMKMSTYILAQRPIFAHTPSDSSLADIVGRYGIGIVCSSTETAPLKQTIFGILSTTIDKAVFEQARSALLGPLQVQNLRAALTGMAAPFPGGPPVLA